MSIKDILLEVFGLNLNRCNFPTSLLASGLKQSKSAYFHVLGIHLTLPVERSACFPWEVGRRPAAGDASAAARPDPFVLTLRIWCWGQQHGTQHSAVQLRPGHCRQTFCDNGLLTFRHEFTFWTQSIVNIKRQEFNGLILSPYFVSRLYKPNSYHVISELISSWPCVCPQQ
jgi:hypothetical protein